MEAFTVADFSGGVTDFVTRSSPKHMEESCNLVVTSDRKLALREGIDFVEGSDVVFPEQKIFELAYIQTDKSNDRIILCDHNYYEFKDLLEDYQVVTIDGEATAVSVSGDYTFPQGIKSDLAPFALMNDQVISGSERFGTQTNKLRGEPVRYPIYSTTQWNDHLIVASDGEPELPVSLIYKSETYRPIIEDGRNIGEEKIARAFTRSAGLGKFQPNIDKGTHSADSAIAVIGRNIDPDADSAPFSYRYAMCLANEYVVDGVTHVERGPVHYFRDNVITYTQIGENNNADDDSSDYIAEGVAIGAYVNPPILEDGSLLDRIMPPYLNEKVKLRTDISDYAKPPDDADVFRWQTEPYWNLKLEIYRTPEGTNQFFRIAALPLNSVDSLTRGKNPSVIPFLKLIGLKTVAEIGNELYNDYLERYFSARRQDDPGESAREFFEALFSVESVRNNFQIQLINNSGGTMRDYIRDEDLVLNLPLYTNAEASLDLLPDNEQPPACKFVHALNDVIYYANYKDNANVVLQSKAARPGAVFFDNPMYLEEPVTGLSSIYGRLLAFTTNRVYRFTGTPLVDDFTGGLTPEEIENTAGCISNRSIVQTNKGLYYFGPTGIYLTNGLEVTKITDHLNKSYKEWIDSVEDPRLIKGVYDEENQRILWSLPEKFEYDTSTFSYSDLGGDKEKLPRALYLVMDLRHGVCFTTKTFALSRSLASATVNDRVQITGGYNTPVPTLEDFQKRWQTDWVDAGVESAETLGADEEFQKAAKPPVVRGWWQGAFNLKRTSIEKSDDVIKGDTDYFRPFQFDSDNDPLDFGDSVPFLNEFVRSGGDNTVLSGRGKAGVKRFDRHLVRSGTFSPERVSIPYRYASTHMDMGKKAQKKYGPKMLLSFQIDRDLKTRFADVNDGDRGQYADHSRDIVLHKGLALGDRAVGRASTETFGYTSGAMQDIWFWLTKMRFEYKQVTFENIDDTIGLDFYLQHYIMYYNVLRGMGQRNIGRI